MTLSIQALIGADSGSCIAVVGAGGKTTLCWRLIQEARQHDQRVLFTTTTKIWEPAPHAFDLSVPHQTVAQTLRTLQASRWRTAGVFGDGASAGIINHQPVANSWMPVITTKRSGLSGEDICQLRQALPDVCFVIEADGARGLMLKAPGADEPVIPACADFVCVLAQLDALGRPLNAQTVHRAERFAHLTGLAHGAPITPAAMIAALTHPLGGLKSIPTHARAIAVLTQTDSSAPHPAAHAIMQALVKHGYQRALNLAPRAHEPVLLWL